MSAFQEHREELERHEQMYGRNRGRLAVTLDRLTNALVLVGQHGVYCTSQRNPTLPAMDLRIISKELEQAKELIQSVIETGSREELSFAFVGFGVPPELFSACLWGSQISARCACR
jgi:hypothetical protein